MITKAHSICWRLYYGIRLDSPAERMISCSVRDFDDIDNDIGLGGKYFTLYEKHSRTRKKHEKFNMKEWWKYNRGENTKNNL